MLAAGRSPWWGSALPGKALAGVALGSLAAIGVAVVDDYGISADDAVQRHLGFAVLYQALGDRDAERRHRDLGELHTPVRFYGTAFETPLAAVERLLGLTDSRDIHLTRHLLTHLLFLAGGGCAALLALRLFRSGWLALLAFALFALHPRLYAHSFFNSKDAAFAAAFMACLALTERAFRRDTAGAFALLGLGVGTLVNLRVMGALLAALVLAAKAVDLMLARDRAARRHTLATGAAFAASAGLGLYALSPYLWRDPSQLVHALAALSAHPFRPSSLFQGEWVRWPAIPPHYLPTWMSITTPLAALALAGVGAAAILARAKVAGAARGAPARFGLLLVACPALAILGIVLANANVYHGWRHFHFLWGPLAIIAVAGCLWLARGAGRRRALKRGVGGLAAAGVAAGAAQMAATHPHQAMYFNPLVDRDVPERLAGRYEMDYWHLSFWEALERVAHGWPAPSFDTTEGHLRGGLRSQALLLPPALRPGRFGRAPAVDFVIDRGQPLPAAGGPGRAPPMAHAVTVYDNTIAAAFALDAALLGPPAVHTLQAERTAAAASAPTAQAGFDLHWTPGMLTWLKAPCAAADVRGEFILRTAPHSTHIHPSLAHPSPSKGLAPSHPSPSKGLAPSQPSPSKGLAPLPPSPSKGLAPLPASPAPGTAHPGREFTERSFNFGRHGVRVDDACMIRTPLPHGPLAAIEAGQRLVHHWKRRQAPNPMGDGPDLWRVAIDLSAGQPVATDVTRPPLPPAEALVELPADAPFDLYLHGRTLVYARRHCRPEDTLAAFFLHAHPADPADLPRGRRGSGFLNLDFNMARHDAALIAHFGGRCAAWVRLPDFAIARLRTGQHAHGAELWRAEFTDV